MIRQQELRGRMIFIFFAPAPARASIVDHGNLSFRSCPYNSAIPLILSLMVERGVAAELNIRDILHTDNVSATVRLAETASPYRFRQSLGPPPLVTSQALLDRVDR